MRITRAQAIKIARAVWGKAAIKDRGARAASTKESREAASREAQELYAKKSEIEKLPGFLDEATYPDDVTLGAFRKEWRERKAALDAYRKRLDELRSTSYRMRYDVGTIFTMHSVGSGFSIKGSGDTWEEAFNKAGITSEKIEQILNPRRVAAKRAVAKLEAESAE